MMKKLNNIRPTSPSEKNLKNNPPGNRTPASEDYKDPVGKNDEINTPKNSGYDEKQPRSEK